MAIRDLPALDRITRARSALITGAPFYGALALQSVLVERPDLETMAVDGRHLFYNPAFVAELSEPELIGVLAHEVSHLAMLHHTRRGGRDLPDWNKAADYCINAGLISAGFTLPRGALIDSAFDGMGAEAVYSELKRRAAKQQQQQGGQGAGQGGQQQGQGAPQPGQQGQPGQGGQQGQQGQDKGQGQQGAGPGQDPGGCGGILDAAPDEAGNAAAASEMESRVRQAIAVAVSAAGEMPGELARIVAELNTPRIPWRDTVDRFVNDAAQSVVSWNRPDKRFLNSGFYMPGRQRDSIACLAAFLDTSGSCSDADVTAFRSECQAILDTGRVERLHVVMVDSKVQAYRDFEPGDVLDLEPAGGGGTRFDVAWSHLAIHAPDAAAAIYLTDLDSRHFGTDPGVPVLWCVTGRKRAAPFGEVIPLDAFA
jgi:predicted metal-dependent peptidase